VSKIRTYKTGTGLGTPIITYTAGIGSYGAEDGGSLAMAESMTFNRQSIGMIGGILEAPKISETQKRYVKFFHQNFEYYTDVRTMADVAVLYSFASMGFNNDRPAVSFMLFTQALIQARVPFEIIFDDHLKHLSKYRVIVLADQECLDEAQLELIRKYVQNGGGLVATQQSSLYTARRLRRSDFGLKDMFKVSAPPWRGPRAPQQDLEIASVQNRIGQGRCSYIPAIKPALEKPPGVPMSSAYWKLPLNWQEIVEQVRWAAGGKFTLEVKAPGTLAVVTEQQEQVGKSRRLVHLLNYAAHQGSTVNNIAVESELPRDTRVDDVMLLTPDDPGMGSLPFTSRDQWVDFIVPRLATYSLAVISLARA
ncbi:MAG: hypothetical protein ACRD2G_17150, partial [Terriglobia bacterium]